MSNETYQITFQSLEIKTLGEYCNEISSPVFKYRNRETELLSIKGPSGFTNRESIFNTYTVLEGKDNLSKQDKDLLLKVGTTLSVPINQVELSGLLTQGLQIVSNDEGIFKAKALADLESDLGYIQVLQENSHQSLGITTHRTPNRTVWVWCRALSFSDTDIEGELIDITPFIGKLNTFVGKNGGNFSFDLSQIICHLETTEVDGKKHNRWVLSKNLNIDSQSGEYLSNVNIFDSDELRRSNFFFHIVLQDNDLVFIRHETLEMEKDQRDSDNSLLGITKFNIPERIYDMIGLIDTNNQSVNVGNNDISIEIKGRDLIKLLIDDGVYFYNLENLSGQWRLAGSSTAKNELMRRIIGSNALYYLNLFQNNSIENIVKFVIQQLSTIEIVPSSLFDGYGDRRNSSFLDLDTSKGEKQVSKDKEDSLKLIKRTLENLEVVADENTVYTHFYQFLRQLRELKTRTIKVNKTAGWKFTKYKNISNTYEPLQANQLPQFIYDYQFLLTEQEYNPLLTSQLHLVQIINQVDKQIDGENTPKTSDKDAVQIKTKGVWQIIKLVIDKGVVNRKLIDGSLSTQQGSLLNFIRKVAQEPFVEFYTDTYGDQFYLIIRKPPFDKVSMENLLKNKISTEKGEVNVLNSIVNIEQHNVLKEDLSFDNSEAYSWYRFEPKNLGSTGGSVLTTLYTPSIYFEEYAKIWGSRPLVVEHNYNPYLSSVTDSGLTDISRFEEQALYDLKYLIESHAYLPFTRQGSITLNGDRRIKRGSFIRHLSTGEIFHVDSVSHSGSISDSSNDSVTTITVSRGMVEKLISGVDVNGTKISYFNIINTDIAIQKKRYPDEKRIVTRTVLEKKEKKIEPVKSEIQKLQIEINYLDLSIENRVELAKIENENNRNRFAEFLSLANKAGYEPTILSVTEYSINITLESSRTSLDSSKSKEVWLSTGLIDVSKSKELRWGGDTDTNYNPTRFEIPKTGYDDKKILSESTTYIESEVSEEVLVPGHVGVNIEKALENLKVNQVVFNFFLKQHQYDIDSYINQNRW